MRAGQARRRDTNEQRIVQALEAIGVVCYRISGDGVPDLLTHRAGVWLPIEVKGRRGRLTPAQHEVHGSTPFPVVRSVDEALKLFAVH